MSDDADARTAPVVSRRRAAVHRSTRALSIRNFRIFFVGEVVSTVGSWMQMLAQAWLVLEITDSGGALGITLALQTLPVLVLGAWGGVVADRVDNRRLLVMTALAGTAQSIAVGTMVASGHITIHWIYFFALLLGVITAFDRPAMQAMNYELAGPDELSSAIGIASTINSGGRLLGPALAGILAGTVGLAPVFFLNAVTFAAVVVAMALIRPAEMYRRTADHAAVRLRDGLSYVWHHPTLRLAMIVMAVVGTFAYNFAIMVPSMIRFEFHSTPIALGVVQAIGGVGSVLGGLVAASFYRPTIRLLGMVTAAFGAFIALSALAPGLALFALVWLPLGVASAAFSTVDQTVLQRASEPQYQGRVMSLFTIAWMGTTPIGGLIAGAVIDTWSARVALGLGATAALAVGSVALALSRRRTFADEEAAEVAAAAVDLDVALAPTTPDLAPDLAAGT
ncbi:MAG TPA: MFS transporter [Acidimicrobiia bacterium]